MRQSPAGKDVNMQAEESTRLGAVTRQKLVKKNREDSVRATVNCKVSKLVQLL
jgi:hypothetical protein